VDYEISLSSHLVHEVLHNPASAALPSNLSDRWLDIALQGAESLIRADEEADPELMYVPVSLVLHLVKQELASGKILMSDEIIFKYLSMYRIELAMEKLRRWGVVLQSPADEITIFKSPQVNGRSTVARKAHKKHKV
jgi:hypothetical protein